MATTPSSFVTVVSGLPRSGTSMMMRVLEGAGLPIVSDRVRSADEDNPHGYFEIEGAKRLKHDAAWLAGCSGKAVKLVSALLENLPLGPSFRIVFMRRSLEEVLVSQARMLSRRGEGPGAPDADLKRQYIHHLAEVESWLGTRPDLETLFVNYGRILADPEEQIGRVLRFLGVAGDLPTLARLVDPKLYRSRG